ncbi:hypothetical protein PFICI_07359 [Pestalotiopsis fici W106-1]|uniref:Carboxylic ester hydrolase n=1 Tax=Pestalotiopsis fici (strain W106-1 / CGMCC3.15140) TaxID=1229662 RepID=W3X180_PESFW|nr:uncharacterized protein PFICI_07359 [Pestalotiopsis fici W106-1]ETS79830.1 hypothetical protein PFICI_07359 [Pestalotiopsis fici W106-1]
MAAASNMSLAGQCTSATFGTPNVFGAEVLAIQAALVTGYSSNVPQAYNFNHGPITVTNASFCNVTNWNRRLQAQGGGGWVSGRFLLSDYGMAGAIGEGYATVTTDAGVTHDLTQTPAKWALNSPSNVNLYGLQNLGSVSLNDMAIFAKDLIQSYYGERPAYSYWNGCSQGGRQGMMLAQRYPDAFDGIAASAPAFNWPEFIGSGLWPDLQMWWAGKAPDLCELDAIQTEAIIACDSQDGIPDGLLSESNNCIFNPFSVVGKSFTCASTNSTMVISEIAAQVANASWTGATSTEGELLWYGPNVGTDLTGHTYGEGSGIVTTTCTNGTCSVTPYSLAEQWTTYFVEKNASFDVSKMTAEDFQTAFHQGVNQFTSMIGSNDPDLRAFHKKGRRIMGFHGLADGIIPTKGTEHYYRRVTEIIAEVQDFYRYFPAPAVGHCFGGPGGVPTTLFDSLRAWVENGTVPEHLPTTFTDSSNKTNTRILCPYPRKSVYDESCGDSTIAECFSCV